MAFYSMRRVGTALESTREKAAQQSVVQMPYAADTSS